MMKKILSVYQSQPQSDPVLEGADKGTKTIMMITVHVFECYMAT